MTQTIPKRYIIRECECDTFGVEPHALDWPRHWRHTGRGPLSEIVHALDTDERYSTYYENTLECISLSQTFANRFEGPDDISIRSAYDAFA